ncbi:aldehyde dehydrogenase family protein [Aestuariicella sp. G3-2]|uniref:aldehyde dehydrogenase family protein n=1 Tax=Pseudomaricurvus albidus TaxID=2842452 RepID=UPI001C0B7499|nr:aldehyde dehydrogenase family protein [Aestuariicella albida]MBU3068448.1 aldehyde dehydrogenase family protein [Aestuariicella albida]
MMTYTQLYLEGQWLNASSNQTLTVINPATEALAAEVPLANAEDVDRAVNAARKAFAQWSQTSAAERKRLLLAIADGMEARKQDLTAAISVTMGCPEHIAGWLQVDGPIEAMRLFAEHTSLTEEIETVEGALVVRESAGVCAFINPWNYPLHQFVGKVGAALAAGCTMVVKPAEQTPLQDFIMAEILHDAGIPAGVFNLVPGTGIDVGEALCTHPEVDVVSFTGSTRAGIEVAKAAASTVKRVTQELGGKSPLIITDDADLQAAVQYGVEDVMLNSGQTCVALTRMLVPASRYDEAVAIAKEIAGGMTVGMHEEAFLGPISSQAQQQKVLDYIQIGIAEGATLVCGGKTSDAHSTGYYVEPTIFANVNNQMRIAREEIFGPVLCMIPYQDIDEAVEIANDTPYGLASAVYAGSEEGAVKIARRIRAGQCLMNGAVFNYHAPFGGYKQSGNGREFSAAGVHEFLEIKAMLKPECPQL